MPYLGCTRYSVQDTVTTAKIKPNVQKGGLSNLHIPIRLHAEHNGFWPHPTRVIARKGEASNLAILAA
jgi:hypothetical protein